MGALTSNRRRGDDYFASNYKFTSSRPTNSELRIDNHISKKLKFSPSGQNSVLDPLVSSKSSAVRVHQYPEKVSRFNREVHAPCRVTRFGSCRASSSKVSNSENSAEVGMGIVFGKSKREALSSNYKNAKREALSSLRFWGKRKDVIDVSDDEEKGRETVTSDGVEDSSIEEVEILEHGKELWKEQNGMELDEKTGEPNFQPSCSSVISEDLTNANLKSKSVGKVLDMVSMNQELDVSGIPVHKKLLYSANKRNEKLRRLDFDIELHQQRRSTFQLYRTNIVNINFQDVVKEPFVPLTDEEEGEVSLALSNAKRRRVLVTHVNSNIEITGELLQCLKPGAWLNDEVINLYLELLKEREKREPQNFLKCHFFNTFFYKKLIGGRSGYDFKSVRRWTTQRKLGYCLLECDKIFVPIHKEIHWCLAVINKKDEKIQYLDSLRGSDKQVMKVLARYFMDEVKDKSGKEIDVSSWKQECVEDLPEQENGFDCGMFMIKYCDFYSRDVGLCFNQEHMPYFRRRTAKEILTLKAE